MNVPDHIWNQLMEWKQSSNVTSTICGYNGESGFLYVSEKDFGIAEYLISDNPLNLDKWEETVVLSNRCYLYSRKEQTEVFETLINYWPIVFLSKNPSRDLPFLMVHMAQSLDGKVCTIGGNSKWIGNQENLTHAHRLRACVDGVLVGGNTLANDLPRLNVRHVSGENPVRLFLTSSFSGYDKLPIVEDTKTYLLSKKIENSINPPQGIDKAINYGDLIDLLKALKVHGINSILIEGGTETVSSFWKAGCIDWVQLHIAPLVLGSGRSCVNLNQIDDVADGFSINNSFYSKVGDAMMVTGQPDLKRVYKGTSVCAAEMEQVQ